MLFRKNVAYLSLICVLSMGLVGCEDSPNQLAGGTVGAVGAGVAGVGIASMMGASGTTAGAVGLVSAMAGGLIGAKIGHDFDKEAKRKIKEAAERGVPVMDVDNNGDEWVYTPSRKRNAEGRAMRVKAVNASTGKEVIIEM